MQNTPITGLGQSARRVAGSLAVAPGWVAIAIAMVTLLAIGDIPLTYQYVPLIISVVLLGLPHGAVDHLVVARHRNESLTTRWLAIVVGIYLIFGLAYGLLWFHAPAVAFVGFILLTWFHWGQGELYPLIDLVGATYYRYPSQQLLGTLVRGGAPMLVPLIAFPEQYAFVAQTLVGLFDAGAAAALSPIFEAGPRRALGLSFATVLVATAALGFYRTETVSPWLVDVTEMALLTGFFLVVPPILAIGIYFCFWHALRHVLRTVLLHNPSTAALDRQELLPVGRQFARDAAPLTAGALVLLGGLYLIVPHAPTTTPDLVALYLVLIAILTLPHVVIVTWLDREQAIFP